MPATSTKVKFDVITTRFQLKMLIEFGWEPTFSNVVGDCFGVEIGQLTRFSFECCLLSTF